MVEEFRSALSRREVPMVEPEVIVRIRGLGAVGWGARRISREVGVARNTVRRYLRGGEGAEARRDSNAKPLDPESVPATERCRTLRLRH
jgi:transposase